MPVARTDRATLHGFVGQHAAGAAAVYTDEHAGYQGLPRLRRQSEPPSF